MLGDERGPGSQEHKTEILQTPDRIQWQQIAGKILTGSAGQSWPSLAHLQ